MRNSLHSHITYLENTIQETRDRLTRRGLSMEEADDLKLQLTLAESALAYYREAYALELAVSGSEPPPAASDQKPGRGGKAPEKSKPREENQGRVRILRRGRTPALRSRIMRPMIEGRRRDAA
jgi:hypothetical protein